MASLTKLKACFVIFCLSIGITAYSPIAKWVFTPNNLVDGKIKDLSSNNNEPFQTSWGSIAESEVTCKGLYRSRNSGAFDYGIVSAITSSTLEYGVSIWMNLQGGSDANPTPVGMIDSSGYFTYYVKIIYGDPTNYNFWRRGDKIGKTVPISPPGKWIFLVFYFVKSLSVWTWTIISPEFSTLILTHTIYPGNEIRIAYHIIGYYYEIQFFKKASINSPIVTLYDSSDAT
ncbi:unnamed protein product [Blepharisma stoltei]|uniref:Uncharacterized protein n=1 Tax=Blepharisma stoltei TaxID=1481888 RepID=A0AAU9JEE1_9CILI|nr:unnamed protein product [Blepharisma stoltei]